MILRKDHNGHWQQVGSRMGVTSDQLVSFDRLEVMLRNDGIVHDDEALTGLIFNIYGIEVQTESL